MSLRAPVSTGALVALSLAAHALMAAGLFGAAGRTDLPWFWATLAVFAASQLAMVAIVFRRDPDLARERLAPGPGQPAWDRVVTAAAGVVLLAGIALSAVDAGRWHASDTVPVALRALGLAGIAGGMAVLSWAMRVNTWFSKVVRIQGDRGQRVVTGGPYAIVRHPGYVGWTLLWLSLHLALGSWIGLALAVPGNGLIVVRTALEDRFLHEGLPGYAEYARRVRWRLVPRVW